VTLIRTHKDLDVYKMAFHSALEIYKLSKKFPDNELYSLTNQIRRSSRSVASNLAEAFRKRKYPKAFVAKLTDCQSEAAETQVWLDFCLELSFIDLDVHDRLYSDCDMIIGKIVNMERNPDKWSF